MSSVDYIPITPFSKASLLEKLPVESPVSQPVRFQRIDDVTLGLTRVLTGLLKFPLAATSTLEQALEDLQKHEAMATMTVKTTTSADLLHDPDSPLQPCIRRPKANLAAVLAGYKANGSRPWPTNLSRMGVSRDKILLVTRAQELLAAKTEWVDAVDDFCEELERIMAAETWTFNAVTWDVLTWRRWDAHAKLRKAMELLSTAVERMSACSGVVAVTEEDVEYGQGLLWLLSVEVNNMLCAPPRILWLSENHLLEVKMSGKYPKDGCAWTQDKSDY